MQRPVLPTPQRCTAPLALPPRCHVTCLLQFAQCQPEAELLGSSILLQALACAPLLHLR